MNKMRLPSMMAVVWWMRRCAWYLGWLPMLGIVSSLLVWALLSQQQQAQDVMFSALEQDIRQLTARSADNHTFGMASSTGQNQAVTANTEVPPEPQPEVMPLPALWQQLPAFAELSPRMMEIAALAHQHHIPLNVGDYQWQVQAGAAASPVQQFDMRFTIQSDYVTCRRFILEVLRRYPTMALTGLELRKNETAQTVVETTLTFSMFIRAEASHV